MSITFQFDDGIWHCWKYIAAVSSLGNYLERKHLGQLWRHQLLSIPHQVEGSIGRTDFFWKEDGNMCQKSVNFLCQLRPIWTLKYFSAVLKSALGDAEAVVVVTLMVPMLLHRLRTVFVQVWWDLDTTRDLELDQYLDLPVRLLLPKPSPSPSTPTTTATTLSAGQQQHHQQGTIVAFLWQHYGFFCWCVHYVGTESCRFLFETYMYKSFLSFFDFCEGTVTADPWGGIN